MISYLCGKVEMVSEKHIIINVNGVGYRVYLAEKSRKSIPEIGSDFKVYTHFSMNPRDGNIELYGFMRPEELVFFELLTSVSGIGPKSAQSILASADLEQLQIGIIRGDDVYLSRVAGIGSKTAQRLVLELKNKIIHSDVSGKTGANLESETDALDALMALGYSQHQAREALKTVSDGAETEEKIKQALKILSRQNK